MKLLIDAEVAQAVINYMAGRPYAEVYKLLPGLTNLSPAPEVAPPTKEVGSEVEPSQQD